ncbi:hypothetical protein VCB98_13580 [Gammaproteobacteria bacterium AB-CW1]|uniref:Uncharacterized protein n=1 Tax=Natronospira elongata TaxID=3110268 RepID=A0AAP6JGX5_9GAMM|nr:hypothetical protein [Gammaproteobacteria bacterium AB-CW1]
MDDDSADNGCPSEDKVWGLKFSEIYTEEDEFKVYGCFASIHDLKATALAISATITDTSWMYRLDHSVRMQFKNTAERTISSLLQLVEGVDKDERLSGEFGELVVSFGSSRVLSFLFGHTTIPISEIWKSRSRQNDSFDFHTVCDADKINFGEAKFESRANPYRVAAQQASRFLKEDKHRHDRVYLRDLISAQAIANLDSDDFGVVVAFSIRRGNPERVLANAMTRSIEAFRSQSVSMVYVLGVRH